MGGFGDFSLSEIVSTAVVLFLFVIGGYVALFWLIARTDELSKISRENMRLAKQKEISPRT